jgi:putative FmdB family regulatory protein
VVYTLEEVLAAMPTYEYECRSCAHKFERFQSITARPVKTCPECGGEVFRVIGTGGGLLFKGSGFYETDYRSDEYKRRARQESGSGVSDKGKAKEKKEKKSKDTGES